MWRKSGIQQALREVKIPESPTFQPLWPVPEPDPAHFNIEVLDPKTRGALAAHATPGMFMPTTQVPFDLTSTKLHDVSFCMLFVSYDSL